MWFSNGVHSQNSRKEMEKYVVAQLEHTSEYICMLDSEFIVFPTPASASSTVLDRYKSHRLGAQSFPLCCQWCTHHTHPTAREATEAEEVKAELGIARLLKKTLQEVAAWSFGLLAIPGRPRGHPACALPAQHPPAALLPFAGKPARPSLDTTPSFQESQATSWVQKAWHTHIY